MQNVQSPLMDHMLHAVRQGCGILKEIYDSKVYTSESDHVFEKNSHHRLKDFLTSADIETEAFIKRILAEKFPGIGFFGEETSCGNVQDFGDKPYFVLDPLDGTSNFVAARDYFAISLGYVEEKSPVIGVIANPVTGEIVAARALHGAYRFYRDNNKGEQLLPIQQTALCHTQLDCELSLTSRKDTDVISLITPHSTGMRKHGSSALDILHMACGRRSALIANNQKPYDIAAGLVIASEVGLKISDWSGRNAGVETPDIVIANPLAHAEIIRLLGGIKT